MRSYKQDFLFSGNPPEHLEKETPKKKSRREKQIIAFRKAHKQRTLGNTLRFIGRDLKRNVKRNVAKNNLKRLPNHNVSNSGKTNMK